MSYFESWEALVAKASRSDFGEELSEALRHSCEHYDAMTFDELCNTPKWPRIFIWHNFVLEMLLGSVVFGESRYSQKVADVFEQLTATNDNGYSLFSSYPPHGPGFLVIGLGIALQAFKTEISAATKQHFLQIIQHYCELISNEQKSSPWGDDKVARLMWNHSIVGYAALYFGGLSLANQHSSANEWQALGREKVRLYFYHGVTQCGVNREGLSYAGMSLKAVVPCLYQEALEAAPLEPELLERMRKYVVYNAYEIVPEGGIQWNYNDSYMNPKLNVNGLLLTAKLTGQEPLGAAIWSDLVGGEGNRSYGKDHKLWRSSLFEAVLFREHTVEGRGALEALPTSRFFSEKGYFSYRSSWKKNAAAFTFSSGPGVDRIHQQSDHNSFTLAVNGRPLIIDSGPSNAKKETSFSQSIAHQSILINGKGMALCGGKASTSGVMESYSYEDGIHYLHGNALPAYNKQGHMALKKASREVWLLENEVPLVVMRDKIRPVVEEGCDFKWLLHTPTGVNGKRVQSKAGKCFEFTCDDTQDGFRLYFFKPNVRIRKVNILKNPKAYDDNLILKHQRWGFVHNAPRGHYWTLILPMSASPQAFQINEDMCAVEGNKLAISIMHKKMSHTLKFQSGDSVVQRINQDDAKLS